MLKTFNEFILNITVAIIDTLYRGRHLRKQNRVPEQSPQAPRIFESVFHDKVYQ